MLTDAQIVELRNDEKYEALLASGTKSIISDVIKSGVGDFKPDVSFAVKFASAFVRTRTIRKELSSCVGRLLENLLNRELEWRREPESIRIICESDQENFIWMRYDAPRIKAVFGRARDLIVDAAFRATVKAHSTLPEDAKNERLRQIQEEMTVLFQVTLRSIGTRALYDDFIKLNAEEHYRANEKAIQDKFLGAARGGALGTLPHLSPASEQLPPRPVVLTLNPPTEDHD